MITNSKNVSVSLGVSLSRNDFINIFATFSDQDYQDLSLDPKQRVIVNPQKWFPDGKKSIEITEQLLIDLADLVQPAIIESKDIEGFQAILGGATLQDFGNFLEAQRKAGKRFLIYSEADQVKLLENEKKSERDKKLFIGKWLVSKRPMSGGIYHLDHLENVVNYMSYPVQTSGDFVFRMGKDVIAFKSTPPDLAVNIRRLIYYITLSEDDNYRRSLQNSTVN